MKNVVAVLAIVGVVMISLGHVSALVVDSKVRWEIPGPPTASLLLLTCYSKLESRVFDAGGSSDPLNDPLTYNFTFSDDFSVNQTSSTYMRDFNTSGNYWLNLTVWDPDELRGWDNQSFAVQSSPCIGGGGELELPELPPIIISPGGNVVITGLAFFAVFIIIVFFMMGGRRRRVRRGRPPPTPGERIEGKIDELLRRRP